jgi:8-oxo-dGTP pyrophosphatase MutT (NUDIX family)
MFMGFEPYKPQKSDAHIHYTVIMARFENKWIFVQHKMRSTLECPGGKREPGESILAAARRELREESGAVRFDLKPLTIYKVRDEKTGLLSSGLLCFAHVRELGPLPESEIGSVFLMKSCPTDMTYPTVLPHIYEYVTKKLLL